MPTPRKRFPHRLIDDRKPNRSLSSDTISAIITAYLEVRALLQNRWIYHTNSAQSRNVGTMDLKDGQEEAEEKEGIREAVEVRRAESGQKKRVGTTKERRCGRCGNTEHNARTCKEDVVGINPSGIRPRTWARNISLV